MVCRTSSLEAQWARVALSGGQLDASALPEEERWSASPLQVVLLTTTGQVTTKRDYFKKRNWLDSFVSLRPGVHVVAVEPAADAVPLPFGPAARRQRRGLERHFHTARQPMGRGLQRHAGPPAAAGNLRQETSTLTPSVIGRRNDCFFFHFGSPQATGGRKEAAVARVFRSLGPSTWTSSSSVGKERLFHHVKVRRLAGVTRATAAACDPDGKNFAVLQVRPFPNPITCYWVTVTDG